MSGAAREAVWEPPPTFDSFEIAKPLGLGGMGRVYAGRDVMLDRLVALKFIASSKPSEDARHRFLIEARAIAKLAHPNVVGVYRIGEVESRPYLAYEFVAGRSLDRVEKPVSWSTALRIAMLLSRGLDAAHAVGIVHRDIKPGNVMLSDRGEVKLLDFGIAKLDSVPDPVSDPAPPPMDPSVGALENTVRAPLTRPGALVGTPGYLAPEVWGGESASPRSDVFAVGLVLWELLIGTLPFAGVAGEDLARSVIEIDIPSIRSRRPDIPQSFADIVDRCVRRHPLARFASASELRAALEEVHAVFLPRSGGVDVVHVDDEARAVAESFTRILPRAQAFTSAVYEKLFSEAPQLRGMFPEDLDGQKSKLAHALRIAIEGLREPERLVPYLQDLGRRHTAYGVTPSHFDTLGAALLSAVREFDGDVWSDELAGAWRNAYGFLSTAMRQGMGGLAPTAVSREMPAVRSAPTPSSPITPPRTLYARSGDASIAYHVIGDGPVDLVVVMGWISHLELAYAHPMLASFLLRLSRRFRVIVFDKRGSGLSDRVAGEISVEQRVEDVRVVMDAVGSERAVLFGIREGATTTALFGAVHPERVRGLVFWAGSARTIASEDYPWGTTPAALDATCETILSKWGEPLFVDREAPSMAGDAAFESWLASYQRMGASPGSAVAMLRASASFDLRRVAPSLSVPTLVLHRRGDQVVPAAAGKHLAELVPGARWHELDGNDHLPFVGNSEEVVSVIGAFVDELPDDDTRALPLSTLVALAGDEPADLGADLARGQGNVVASFDGVAVFAFDTLTSGITFARAAAAWGASVGVHVGPCARRRDDPLPPSVRLAAALAKQTNEGAISGSELLHDLGYGIAFTLERTSHVVTVEGTPWPIVLVK